MTELLELLRSPWPWYVDGPLIGLTVPLLLWLGNKGFGISANLRHACAILLPDAAKPAFFRYDWRKERWNLMFAGGLILGGIVAGVLLGNPEPTRLSAAGVQSIQDLGVQVRPGLMPAELTDLSNPGVWLLLAVSGLLVGFGTRYGGGCTSGHAITGLSTLQGPSLIATVSFFAGGILSANLLLPTFMAVLQ
ncbi:YeeE/YedE thiosulfate transporter family protein [Deinococcus soli (ex Cha et al. 2016)]|uniref:Membrane protein YedE/YeeE n=2 Tax=Deinococcus soli (ex Cha et al. 2016) TaxID=1309411 RepID=A0AAE3XGI7_9DEIO|nr:YeeE/YedE thiosulfate transporter family protein [Deinococcus soli (ex Cha et al. 2016)]MDR6220946.1 putative membrane protein YedE/YeeE [Deinococcus soli (ex Cha et al. 2016)]MDR6330939.1 putative membrane protein YedE/YeeE [Deinococcus soli (ex Cha et al. 2016)]MDR6753668.1 putative membrane protein YedE/YeeE [Deinococcus soli (ex Cha et al. 2016)]